MSMTVAVALTAAFLFTGIPVAATAPVIPKTHTTSTDDPHKVIPNDPCAGDCPGWCEVPCGCHCWAAPYLRRTPGQWV